jgi:hypothetical protein
MISLKPNQPNDEKPNDEEPNDEDPNGEKSGSLKRNENILFWNNCHFNHILRAFFQTFPLF